MLCVGGGVIKELALGTLPEWILTGGGGGVAWREAIKLVQATYERVWGWPWPLIHLGISLSLSHIQRNQQQHDRHRQQD